MEFRHFKYFIAVAEELHFGRAAQKLHIEQSPLSRSIQDLEDQLGLVLLERSTRHVRLTPAGAAFLKEAQHVVASIRRAQLVATTAANDYQGSLRIGLSNSVIQPRLTMAIAKYRAQYPEIEVRIYEMSYAEQLVALHSEQLDAGLAFIPTYAKGLINEILWQDPVVALLPKRHPLCAQPAILACKLHNHPLVICRRDTEPGLYEQVAWLLQMTNIDAMATHTATSLQGLITLVAAQCGVGFAGAHQIDDTVRSEIEVRAVIGQPAQLTTSILRMEQPMSRPLQGFIEHLQNYK